MSYIQMYYTKFYNHHACRGLKLLHVTQPIRNAQRVGANYRI